MVDAAYLTYIPAGAAMLVVAALALAVEFRPALNRAFALLLVVRGTLLCLTPWSTEPAVRAYLPYLAVAAPFAMANFLLTFLRAFGAGSALAKHLRAFTLGLAILAESAYLVDHALWQHADGADGPLTIAFGIPAFAAFGAACATAVAAIANHSASARWRRRHPGAPRPDAGALRLLACALVLHPLHVALPSLVAFDATRAVIAALALGLGACAVALVVLGAGVRAPTAWWTLGAAGLSVAAGAAALASSPRWVHYVLNAFWLLPLPLLGGYAVVRRRVFHLDVGVRFAVHASTVALVVTGLFTLLEIAVAEQVPWHGPARLAALVGTVVAIRPVHHIVARLTQRFGQPKGPHAAAQRRIAIYRAAWLAAHASHGHVPARQEGALDRLAAELGMKAHEVEAARAPGH